MSRSGSIIRRHPRQRLSSVQGCTEESLSRNVLVTHCRVCCVCREAERVGLIISLSLALVFEMLLVCCGDGDIRLLLRLLQMSASLSIVGRARGGEERG
jgi:hypothetical protein